MSDLYNYNDPNFRRNMQDVQPAPAWVSLAAIGAIVAMFVLIGMFSGSDTQTASNGPAIETTGSGGSTTPAPGGAR